MKHDAVDPGRRVLMALLYLALSIAFVVPYMRNTARWSSADFRSFNSGVLDYPNALDSFRYRVLTPALGRAIFRLPGADPRAAYVSIAIASVWGSILAFRALLARFTSAARGGLLAPILLYPLIWNYVLLNRLYYPFDMPQILLILLGWNALGRLDWRWFYPLLALATLNHEGSAILIPIAAVTFPESMRPAARFGHLAAMIALWLGIVVGTRVLLSGAGDMTRNDWLAGNLSTLADMLTGRGDAWKDWAKLALSFGGMIWLLPFVLRDADPFLRRSLWASVPFVIGVLFRGILHEVRVYGELVPLIAAPVACAIATRLDRRDSANARVAANPQSATQKS